MFSINPNYLNLAISYKKKKDFNKVIVNKALKLKPLNTFFILERCL